MLRWKFKDVPIMLWLTLTLAAFAAFTTSVRGADLYVQPHKDRQEKEKPHSDYPSLLLEGRDEGVILIIGFEGCVHCKTLIGEIPKDYRVFYVQYNEADELNESEDPPKWDELRVEAKLDAMYPACLIMVKGEISHSFTGSLDWVKFRDHAKPAKLKKKERKQIRRSWIDYFRGGSTS